MPPQATLTLPPGWVELPPSDAPPKRLRRRDPFEALAREIVSSGAVIPALLGPTRDYLRHMAQADPNALAVATYIAAPTRTENTFANLLVLGPVLVPRLDGGEVDWDEIAQRAASPGASRAASPGASRAASAAQGEAPTVEPVQVPWGPAVKVDWTHHRSAERHATAKPAVGYWVLAEHLESLIVIQGDVSAGSTDESSRLLADIDAIVGSMRVSAG